MRVLVTGSCGFLGSHVCELFKGLGWEVIGIDNLTTFEMKRSGYKPSTRYYTYNLLKKMGIQTLVQDLVNYEKLRDIKVDYIIHTAAQPTMTLSISNPRYDLMNNIVATFNILELGRKLDVPVSICSSVHVFGNDINKNLIEEETRFKCIPESLNEDNRILNGEISPLHASKASTEIYGQAFIDTYGLKVGIMRLTGMYGPRQFAGMHHGWVSNFIIRILKDLPISIYGTDKQVRDILYCTDASRVFLKYYENQKPGLYIVGGGPECAISLKEVIGYVSILLGKEPYIKLEKERFGDLYYFVSDISKASKNLDWRPSVKPSEGLLETTGWIKNNLELFRGIV
jgi:CDP-paratose 2-epimerase